MKILVWAAAGLMFAGAQNSALAQHVHTAEPGDTTSEMLMLRTDDVTLMAMAQAFPTFTRVLDQNGWYITQPAIMANLSNHSESLVVRTTLNFEGMTQPDGELTYGGWGEGFIDKRHPHTLLHEFAVSWNHGSAWRGWSVSAGKGFAPYGTADPMSRPVIKYPTNHHLSQVLERWFVSGVVGLRSWGLEASVFGGTEPAGPYDFSNIESFGNSWSARVTKRFGRGAMNTWPWELAASHAYITEEHDGAERITKLDNVSVRHERASHYVLLEASHSDGPNDDDFFSVLGEGALRVKAHRPYLRLELATRPEYLREGPRGTDGYFRYDHDSEPIGATRWFIGSLGYGLALGDYRIGPRPYVEANYHRVRQQRGSVPALQRDQFWSISAGVRIFFGGEPMRMGTYGVLDPMRAMHEMAPAQSETQHH